jgi:hypothetical protein
MKMLSVVETPWTAEPQSELEKHLVAGLNLLTSDVVVQFQDYAGSPGGRECRFQSSNVFESGWLLCQRLEAEGYQRILEDEPTKTRSAQVVTAQYQRENVAIWLIANPIYVQIIVFEPRGSK